MAGGLIATVLNKKCLRLLNKIDSDWVFRILSQLTSFLESLQYEKDTEISKEYDCWPIRKSEEIYEKWVWLNVRIRF